MMDKQEKVAKAIFENRNPGRTWETDIAGDNRVEWLKDADAVIAALATGSDYKPDPAEKEQQKAKQKAVEYEPLQTPPKGGMFSRKK